MPSTYSFAFDGRRAVVDRSQQVLRAELKDDAGWHEGPPPEACDEGPGGIRVAESGATWQAPIYPSVQAAGVEPSFTPLVALSAKAKAFNDRLYAHLETLIHEGAGAFPGLFACLAELRAGLEAGTRARGLLDAADHLMGAELAASGPPRLQARRWLALFRKNPLLSKPVGFYSQSDALSRIFRHDRLLQSEFGQQVAAEFRAALAASPAANAAYETYLRFCARVTGKLAAPTVRDESANAVHFIPPSDSAEVQIVEALFGNAPVPPGFKVTDELIARIHDGRLDTTPQVDDGWYAYQFHANAALLTPDTEGLQVGTRYRAELEETFKMLFALDRETHVKQLKIAAAGAGAMPLIIRPRVSVEPLPEYYARIARGYAFVRGELEAILGADTVHGTAFERQGTLGDALVRMELLFAGAESAARNELGRAGERTAHAMAAQAYFRVWQASASADPAFAEDLRVAVPVFQDTARETTRICVTLGVQKKTLEFGFVERPQVQTFGEVADVQFHGESVSILSTVSMECDVREVPSREELRALCDGEKTPARIRAALEAR